MLVWLGHKWRGYACTCRRDADQHGIRGSQLELTRPHLLSMIQVVRRTTSQLLTDSRRGAKTGWYNNKTPKSYKLRNLTA